MGFNLGPLLQSLLFVCHFVFRGLPLNFLSRSKINFFKKRKGLEIVKLIHILVTVFNIYVKF